AALATIDGAAHFMIATHAGEVGRLLGEHVDSVEIYDCDPYEALRKDVGGLTGSTESLRGEAENSWRCRLWATSRHSPPRGGVSGARL
ncbi:MAG: hypothetical protein WAM72_02405, partial [Xanthobacteraceae bacterium]